MNEVKMAKVIMELGEFGEFWEEYQQTKRESEYYQKRKNEIQDQLERFQSNLGEWFVLHPSGERERFNAFWEAKERAVELSERTGMTYKVAEVKETVTKGEKF